MRHHLIVGVVLTLSLCVWGCKGETTDRQSKEPASARTTKSTALEGFGAGLATAIWKGDLESAMKFVPTLEELQKIGMLSKSDKAATAYQAFLEKRKKGFARVTAKFKRKNPNGCKTFSFSRIVKRQKRKLGSVEAYQSVDLFAKCDGREIWVADPDMVFKTEAGWRLMEFN